MKHLQLLSWEEKKQIIEDALANNEYVDKVIMGLFENRDLEAVSYALKRMEELSMFTFEYYLASYEFGKIRHEQIEKQLSLLQELFEISFDEVLMLEASVLYSRCGQISKARKILKQMILFYEQSEQVNVAKEILGILESKGTEEVVKGYEYLLQPKYEQVNSKNQNSPEDRLNMMKSSPPIMDHPSKNYQFPIEIEKEFRDLIGMNAVKEKLYEFYQMNWLAKERKEVLGLDVEDTKSYNFILYGNPGTGKTTVARIIGKLLYNLGLRKSDQTIEIDRSRMVGAYIGQTEEIMSKLLDRVKEEGSTLFIDEAYSLYRKGNEKDFGIEAINCLLKDMEDNRSTYSVIMAGYKKPMDEMLNEANPGFKSRFTYHIHIPDYSNEELLEIAEKIAKKQKYILSVGAKKAIIKRIDKERIDETFANARFIRDLLNDAQMKMAIRVSILQDKDINDLMILKSIDFGINEETLTENSIDYLLSEINSLVGLQGVKEKVQSIVNSIQVRQEAEKHGVILGDNIGTLHMVFKGNAGTGKTTVARIIGKIYKELGVLKRGDTFIECNRSDLVGMYQGHTAEKVKNKIKEALGGILFIDEAYSLCRNESDSFGQEAIDTLVADIENNRQNLMVILAGYSTDMDEFLKKNQGLSSRLSNEIIFEDYSLDEMVDIFYGMMQSKNRIISNSLRKNVYELLDKQYKAEDFGNARGVRNIVDKVINNMDSRIALMMKNGIKLSKDDFITLQKQDMLD